MSSSGLTASSDCSMALKKHATSEELRELAREMMAATRPRRTAEKRRALTESDMPRQMVRYQRDQYVYQRLLQNKQRRLPLQHVSQYYQASYEYSCFRQRHIREQPQQSQPQPMQAEPVVPQKLRRRDGVDKAKSEQKSVNRIMSREQVDENFLQERFSRLFRKGQFDFQRQINRPHTAGLQAKEASPRKPRRKFTQPVVRLTSLRFPAPQRSRTKRQLKPDYRRAQSAYTVKEQLLPTFSSSEDENVGDVDDGQSHRDFDIQSSQRAKVAYKLEDSVSDVIAEKDEEIGFKTILNFMVACSSDVELFELTDEGYKSSIVLNSSPNMTENKFYGLTTSSRVLRGIKAWQREFRYSEVEIADKPLKLLQLFHSKQSRPVMKPYTAGDDILPPAGLRQPSSSFVWAKPANDRLTVAQSDISYLEEVGREGLRILSFVDILNQAIDRALVAEVSHKVLKALHNSSKAANKDLLLVNTILTGACVQLKRDSFLLGCSALDAQQKERLRHAPWVSSTDLFNPLLMEAINQEHVLFLQSKSMSCKSSDKRKISKTKPSTSALRGNQSCLDGSDVAKSSSSSTLHSPLCSPIVGTWVRLRLYIELLPTALLLMQYCI